VNWKALRDRFMVR